jgi:hypothetical protein
MKNKNVKGPDRQKRMRFALLTILRRAIIAGYILVMVVTMVGWTIFLGWMLWYLIDFAFT